jgi:hypothetical protein
MTIFSGQFAGREAWRRKDFLDRHLTVKRSADIFDGSQHM